ncbi:MAG: DUF2200 family protein [Erysipelotrichaceae bacterium]|nr:DUF2200 family protein [Erysipelotrichaceae bacterium]
MSNKIYDMKFKKVFQLLIDKAEKKGKTRQDVIILTNWLTGYSSIQIEQFFNSDISYGDFFNGACNFNDNCKNITGKICNVDISSIEDETMRRIRYLDKLIDLLAKGKTVDQIIKKYENPSK